MADRAFHVAGAGLLALDVVMADEGSPWSLTFAGGTCGNVLSILSYLECTSSAIGYVGNDDAGRRMVNDLVAVGVQAKHLHRCDGYNTPVFVQDLQRDAVGRPQHRFSQRCPSCGQNLSDGSHASHAVPIREFAVEEAPHVFFMDRLSADILALAASAKSRGALVFYEPSARSDMTHWAEALALIDVLKYSGDRFDTDDFAPFLKPSSRSGWLWEVQTLGSHGLRYRRHSAASGEHAYWKASAALPAPRVVDTCGAGDWCTAGLLYGLFTDKEPDEHARFGKAVVLGQALAAWACAFVGARGAMYCGENTLMWRSVRQLERGERIDPASVPEPSQPWRRRASASDDDAHRCWHVQIAHN